MKYINLLFIHISYIFFQIAMFLKIGVCVCIYIYIYIYIYKSGLKVESPADVCLFPFFVKSIGHQLVTLGGIFHLPWWTKCLFEQANNFLAMAL